MKRSIWRVAGAAAVTTGTALAAVVLMTGSAAADRSLAKAKLVNSAGAVVGSVTFLGHGVHADRVRVEVALPNGAPGLGGYHGFHVHAIGNCTAPAFTSSGGHWNPSGVGHGSHKGDMPSVLVGLDGKGYAEFDTQRFDVGQLFDADGSAVVLHAGPDNFGNVPIGGGKYEDPNDWFHAATGTNNTGDAGGRYGCGVVTPV